MTDWDPAAWPEPAPKVAAMVERAPLDIWAAPAGVMTSAGGWCAPALAAKAVRLAIMAWAIAVGGDDSLLLRICDEQQAGFFLNPGGKDWAIAPGPVVTGISIWRLDSEHGGTPGRDAVIMQASWDFTGAQRYAGPVAPPGWTAPGDWDFTGMLTMALTGDEPFPWRLMSGHVDTVDHVLGYTFRTRDETPAEYRERTGPAVSAGPLMASGTYRLNASFAEHDHKFGGSATAEVVSDQAPARAEAQRLAEEAIDVEARRQLAGIYPRWGDIKEGDAHPSLNSLELVRLLDVAPVPRPGE
jgi:hypothetical protein